MKLKNHPNYWLEDGAAKSLERFERDHGVISINSAGRSVNEQNELIDRWYAGGAANRPPHLYMPAIPAETSNHVKRGGVAIDTGHISLMLRHGKAYGWVQNYKNDPVHFEYEAWRDTKNGTPKFPLKSGSYFGPANPTSNVNSVSGFYGNSEHLRTWQNRMKERGWFITVDGLYGDNTATVARMFQAEKGLTVDGLIGPATWEAAWSAPVT